MLLEWGQMKFRQGVEVQAMKHFSDLKLFHDFLTRWSDNSPDIEDDPVVRKVRVKARKLVHKWGWADREKGVITETLMNLAKGGYRGDGPLDGYISRMVLNEIRRLWRKEGSDRRIEMPADLEEGRSFAAEVESKLSDRTKRLLLMIPDGHRWYAEAVIAAEGYLSERAAAAKGNVTKHEIEKLRKELRQIWERMESELGPTLQRKTKVRPRRRRPSKTSVESKPPDRAKAKTAGD